nr:ParA family protein [Paracoccus saliphilus]
MRLLIHNQKGGVGKTTTAANLGAALLRARRARAVLLADLDPQMHLTAMLGADTPAGAWNVADWLGGHAGAAQPVAEEPGLTLIPGAPLLPERLVLPAETAPGQWTLLDSAPGWSPQVEAVSHWADLVLCPLEPDFLGLSGASRLLARFDDIGVPRSRIRFLLCRFNGRLGLHQDVQARLTERFGPDLVLAQTVRSSVRIAEAPGFGRTIFAHAPGSNGCTDYERLAKSLAPAGTPATGRNAA